MDKTLKLFAQTRTVVAAFAEMVAGIFADVVTQAAPILAPLPPAFAIYTAMATKTPQWVAIATACAIELIGMFSSKETVRVWNWNKTRIKSEPRAPFPLALSMSAVYFVVALALSIGVEIMPDALIIIYPGFVVIAASTYVTLAIAHDLATWERERAERHAAQSERRTLGAEIRAQKAQLAQVRAQCDAAERTLAQARASADHARAMRNDAPRMSIDERRKRVAEMTRAGKGRTEIVSELGVSKDTIRRDLVALNGSANHKTRN